MHAKNAVPRTTVRRAALRWAGMLFLCLLIALVALVLRAAFTPSSQRAVPATAVVAPSIDLQAAARRLGKALTFHTVWNQAEQHPQAFLDLHDHMRESFPLVHAKLERFNPAGHSLLYIWRGKDSAQNPVLLMSHLDVVPVSAEETGRWKHDPWGGEIAPDDSGREFIWGRGALDVKSGALALLEAVEALLARDPEFRPAVDIHFAFGHDEESGGVEGNLLLARWVAANKLNGRKYRFVLDEGGVIVDGVMPGLDRPLGLVATAEKGYGTIKLSIQLPPGHSSMPPPHTAVGALAAALARLEERPMPASLAGNNPAGAMLDAAAGDAAWPHKLALANRDVLSPLLLWKFAQTPSLNAVVRTTASVNVIRGGETENVQPPSAEALVNYRLHPMDTLDDVLAHVKSVVNDERIQIEFKAGARPASPVASHESAEFQFLADTIHRLDPEIVVTPGLSVVATDSRHFQELAQNDNVFRFLPMRLNAQSNDLGRIHGIDERIAVENYAEIVQFMALLLQTIEP